MEEIEDIEALEVESKGQIGIEARFNGESKFGKGKSMCDGTYEPAGFEVSGNPKTLAQRTFPFSRWTF